MKLIGVETVDMETGTVRIVDFDIRGKSVTVKNYIQGSFEKPFNEVTNKELKELFKELSINSGNIFLCLPESECRSKIWHSSASWHERKKEINSFIDMNKSELNIQSDTVIRYSCTGNVGESCYGIVSSIHKDTLMQLNKTFKGFKLLEAVPMTVAHSMLRYGDAKDCYGVVELNGTSFSMMIYDKSVLIWVYNGQAEDEKESCGAIIRAMNLAGIRRMYPTELYITGSSENMDDIAETLSSEEKVPCKVKEYECDGVPVGAEMSTLIGAVHGMFSGKRIKSRTINIAKPLPKMAVM